MSLKPFELTSLLYDALECKFQTFVMRQNESSKKINYKNYKNPSYMFLIGVCFLVIFITQ